MRYLGSARLWRAGDRVLAIANFIYDFASPWRSSALQKFVSARRRNQVAAATAPQTSVLTANEVKSLARFEGQRKFHYGYASN